VNGPGNQEAKVGERINGSKDGGDSYDYSRKISSISPSREIMGDSAHGYFSENCTDHRSDGSPASMEFEQ
jgi:hypothetical protein